jgi:xanthosine utilization system XapX-like protein
MAGRFWWLITMAAGLAAGVFIAGLTVRAVPPPVRLVGDLAWLTGLTASG